MKRDMKRDMKRARRKRSWARAYQFGPIKCKLPSVSKDHRMYRQGGTPPDIPYRRKSKGQNEIKQMGATPQNAHPSNVNSNITVILRPVDRGRTVAAQTREPPGNAPSRQRTMQAPAPPCHRSQPNPRHRHHSQSNSCDILHLVHSAPRASGTSRPLENSSDSGQKWHCCYLISAVG